MNAMAPMVLSFMEIQRNSKRFSSGVWISDAAWSACNVHRVQRRMSTARTAVAVGGGANDWITTAADQRSTSKT